MKKTNAKLSLSVHHWRFEDGKTVPNPGSRWEMEPAPRGWYCWVYVNDNDKFEKWMSENCPTAESQHRFNGGDPMYTVQIYSDEEAEKFQQKWFK